MLPLMGIRCPVVDVERFRLKHLEPQVSEQQSPPRLPKQDTESNSRKLTPAELYQLRLEYSANKIFHDPLQPACGNDVYHEAELDLRRASKSADHAEAVRLRWQLPILADVPIHDKPFLSREWAHEWWDFKLRCLYEIVERRPIDTRQSGSKGTLDGSISQPRTHCEPSIHARN
jgi:hypothetical protein